MTMKDKIKTDTKQKKGLPKVIPNSQDLRSYIDKFSGKIGMMKKRNKT